MRKLLPLFSVVPLVLATGAFAKDRAVTDAEKPKLMAAIAAAGCSGGDIEFDVDDQRFEVDDAICNGRKHDLKFDVSYNLTRKSVDD